MCRECLLPRSSGGAGSGGRGHVPSAGASRLIHGSLGQGQGTAPAGGAARAVTGDWSRSHSPPARGSARRLDSAFPRGHSLLPPCPVLPDGGGLFSLPATGGRELCQPPGYCPRPLGPACPCPCPGAGRRWTGTAKPITLKNSGATVPGRWRWVTGGRRRLRASGADRARQPSHPPHRRA